MRLTECSIDGFDANNGANGQTKRSIYRLYMPDAALYILHISLRLPRFSEASRSDVSLPHH